MNECIARTPRLDDTKNTFFFASRLTNVGINGNAMPVLLIKTFAGVRTKTYKSFVGFKGKGQRNVN